MYEEKDDSGNKQHIFCVGRSKVYICVNKSTNPDTMQKAQVHGTVHTRGKSIKVNLFVILFEDNGAKIAYCPALDVYGYGRYEQEARESFELCLAEFLDYTIKKKTLVKELESLGWTIEKQLKRCSP